MPLEPLESPITELKSVGPQRAKMLRDEMGISTYGDLLLQFPSKHVDRSRIYFSHELTPEMPFVQLRGQILRYEEEGVGRKRRLVGHFSDGHGIVDLVWFNGLQYVRKLYQAQTEYIVFGKPTFFNGRWNITHPEIERASVFSPSTVGLRPIYSVPEKLKKRGINSRFMRQLVDTVFRLLHNPIPETLPEYLLNEMQLMGRDEAIRMMHYPRSAEDLARATYRLKFEELFFIQLGIFQYSRERNSRTSGHVFGKVGETFMQFYNRHLPFSLTEAQKRVIREIRIDTQTGRQMNRLLQGDVGSGKTLVALMCMLLAKDNGCQACLMAPTEILAEQHLDTFRNMLGDMDVRVALLTGSVKGRQRKEVFEKLLSGEIDILIGTHAVIEDNVQFRNLGFVVIDEQHRFGVAQRAKMWSKNPTPPHILVMTATPIPRTLAMTVYGDLDVSIIDELPPGRKPVRTIHYFEGRRKELYNGLRKQISEGRQAYVVFPLIKEGESTEYDSDSDTLLYDDTLESKKGNGKQKIDQQNLEDGFLQFQSAFPDLRLSKVHGQMKPAEKDAEMSRFVSGETQILLATTVIEVGVNVPNASVMVIMNAERFGLAQLHQLRGRVGRGADQSYCILVTGFQLSSDTRRRIQIMTETNDGFVIAEEDMRLRGPGDLEGTQQSGIPFDLHIANLARDGQLVSLSREVARRIVNGDPDRSDPRHLNMWMRLNQLRSKDVDWASIS
mgnify:FL=1